MVAEVHYEWKPSLCTGCKSLGHSAEECRKQMRKEGGGKVWVAKVTQAPQTQVKQVAQENHIRPGSARIRILLR